MTTEKNIEKDDSPKKKGLFTVMMDKVEKFGNKLPQPVTLFAILVGLTLILSLLFGGYSVKMPGTGIDAQPPEEHTTVENLFTKEGFQRLITLQRPETEPVIGTEVEYITVRNLFTKEGIQRLMILQRPVTETETGTEVEYITVENLLTKEGIQRIMTSMVDVFAEFPPLGLVLVVMLGIGVAEYSGMIAVALKVFVSKVPKFLITFFIVVAGMMSSVAADAGYVVLIPLGAAIFMSMGRHPLAGLAAAFAGVSGGFGANFLPTGLDPMIAAFTQPAAQILDPTYTVNPLSNYYLMAASVPLVGLAGAIVTEKFIVPRLGSYTPPKGFVLEKDEITPIQRKGLNWAVVSIIAMLGIIAIAIVPENGLLRADDGSFDPFYNSIVPLMFMIFFIAGLVYGFVTKTITGDKDVAKMTSDSMATMGGYIVLAFVAAQFVAYFNWSNLGLVVAVNGAEGLKNIGFTGMPLLVAFIIVSSFINLIIGSASAKWAILAPIFVPMLMLSGYSPETTQAAYRIGDSYSNILTPLLPYFPLVIVFAQKYVKNIGIGTLISLMIPYAVAFMIARIPMFLVWIWLEIPLGIEGPIFYP